MQPWRNRGLLWIVACSIAVAGLAQLTPADADPPRNIGAPPTTACPPASITRVMAVGDSISQGLEGDWTWRYRLRNHLNANTSCPVIDFVGPWRGTTYIPASLPPDFPETSGPPKFDGVYRNNTTFDSDHYARWGRAMHEAKDNIQGEILRQAQVGNAPSFLLVELGFNDLAWGVNSPDGLIGDVKTFVDQARLAKPDMKFLIANVVNRTPLPHLPNLMSTIANYNSKLPAALDSKDTDRSPVTLVELNGIFNPVNDAYDGLHPNGVGEYRIARAFADVLATKFGVGNPFGSIPASVPDLQPGAPGSMNATPTDSGITVSWPHVFGASGYWLWVRNASLAGDWYKLPLPIPADSWRVGGVVRGTTYEYRVQTARGDWISSLSTIAGATANPKTPDPPPTSTITVTPGNGYIDLAWPKPTGAYADTITGYKIYAVDNSVTEPVLLQTTTSSLNARLTGVVNGHSYALGIASVGTHGEGPIASAPAAIPGGSGPGATTLTSVAPVPNSCCDVDLTWTPASGTAAGYWIWLDDITDTAPRYTLPYTVSGPSVRVSWLTSGAANYSFCVQAANGSLRGPISNCRRVDGVSASATRRATAPSPSGQPMIKGRESVEPRLGAAAVVAPIAEYLREHPEAIGHATASTTAEGSAAATPSGRAWPK